MKQEESSTKDNPKWNEEAKRSIIMFIEAYVEVVQYTAKDLE